MENNLKKNMEELYKAANQYLDGYMTEAERGDFETKAATDPATARVLSHVRDTRARLQSLFGQDSTEPALKQSLDALGEAFFKEQNTEKAAPQTQAFAPMQVRHSNSRWWAIAAGVLALSAAVWFLMPRKKPDLYAAYRDYPEAAFTEKSTLDASKALEQAAQLFNKGDFAGALPLFQQALAAKPNDAEIQLYQALCLVETGNNAQAEPIFAQIIATKGAWASEAQWYEALAFLRKNDKQTCVERLRLIAADNRHYAAAQRLLKEL